MHLSTLYSLLEQAADRHGERTAVAWSDEFVTYRELRDRSSRLSQVLLDHGAGPGECVAFSFKKSIDAIACLFAIIRTGATYVPIDPAWPAARIQLICRDAGIRIWTGTAAPQEGVSDIESALVVEPKDGCISIAQALRSEPCFHAAAPPRDGVANILYTSGSTGAPKGVRITTRSLDHFSAWAVDYFGLGFEDRLANHAPFNFDLSTLDIFGAVRAGATLCPVPEPVRMFPYQMAAFIAERGITTWYSVPSALVMMQLRGRLKDHDFSKLRHVIFAGEVMPKPSLQSLAPQLPGVTLTNLYGPTETNVCTFHEVVESDLAVEGPLPIGRPIPDTRTWIMDVDGTPVADSTAGELWVAGPTVTAGYHADPELTAVRLVSAPDGEGHAYRTGDRVRRRDDGVLLFEGRIDRMIKCRGHRIEPGEVEAALHQHPGVREAAVIPQPDPTFGNRLKACIAVDADKPVGESDLVAFCRDKLPPYMVPDVWQFHDALPRTDRGKVDTARLGS